MGLVAIFPEGGVQNPVEVDGMLDFARSVRAATDTDIVATLALTPLASGCLEGFSFHGAEARELRHTEDATRRAHQSLILDPPGPSHSYHALNSALEAWHTPRGPSISRNV